MPHPNPRLLIPVAILGVFGIGGWYIEQQRARERSTLSGFFESQPTQAASRLGGRTAKILVKEGETVHKGQILIVFEDSASQTDTSAKQAQAEQAQAMARETRNGARQEEISKQEAAVAEARANLAKLRNGPLPEEIGAARAKLNQAQAQYRKMQAGARPQEIEAARAVERNARAKLAQAERGPTPEEKAQASARYESAQATEILAKVELTRTEGLVKEGADAQQHLDHVRADYQTAQAKTAELREALRQSELGTPKEEMEQARESYQQAKASLDLVLAGSRKEDIEAAKQEVAAAQQDLELLQRGSRPEDIQAARAKLAQAQSSLDELKAGNRKEQIEAANAAAKAAEEQAKSSRSNLGERDLRAPQDGVVERILIAVGDLVAPGTTVLRLTNPDDIWIRVYVPERNLAKVSVGSEAVLRVDGISDPVSAYVESIATHGEFTPANLQTPDERGKQVFAVRLRPRKPDGRIRSGMFATVKKIGEQTW